MDDLITKLVIVTLLGVGLGFIYKNYKEYHTEKVLVCSIGKVETFRTKPAKVITNVRSGDWWISGDTESYYRPKQGEYCEVHKLK